MNKLVALVITAMFATVAVTPSNAARERALPSAYDGLWSVSIFTQSGPCASSYRYPARISGGRVLQADDDFSYQIHGVVASNGQSSVTVSQGGQSATGYGRLSRSRGAGWWRAAGGQCSGTWTAIRRG